MFQAKLIQALLVAGMLHGAVDASAECDLLTRSLNSRIEDYQAFHATNMSNLQALLKNEESCKSQGATASASMARAAEARSCETFTEAERMNGVLVDIGVSCESNFKKIEEIQESLRLRFSEVKEDVDLAFELMKASRILQEDCPKEVKVTKSLVKEFLALETSIVNVRTRSTTGRIDYGKFSTTAKNLREQNLANRKACQSGESLVANLPVSKATFPNRPGVPAGLSVNPQSDVTGVRVEALLSEGGAPIGLTRPGLEKAATGGSATSHTGVAASSRRIERRVATEERAIVTEQNLEFTDRGGLGPDRGIGAESREPPEGMKAASVGDVLPILMGMAKGPSEADQGASSEPNLLSEEEAGQPGSEGESAGQHAESGGESGMEGDVTLFQRVHLAYRRAESRHGESPRSSPWMVAEKALR